MPRSGADTVGEAAVALWCALGSVVRPFAPLILKRRLRRGKEDPERWPERLGTAGAERPAGRLIWIHAASIGEMNAALPLISRVQDGGVSVLLTTVTVTSAQLAERRLPEKVVHQFAPVDLEPVLDRFLGFWRPSAALIVESELWPATIRKLHRQKTPLGLVNGRLSDRSFRRWRRARPVASSLLGRLDICVAQTEADGAKFTELGASPVVVAGNLKFDSPVLPVDSDVFDELRTRIAGRPTIVAASTHEGEESAVIAAHSYLVAKSSERAGRPLTVMVPRHPDRGDSVAQLVKSARLGLAQRSTGAQIGPDTDIYIADTIGEMGLWYRLATVAILGGSFVDRGGQNPVEPAMLGAPIVSGRHVSNFRDIYMSLEAANAVTMTDAESLAEDVGQLLNDQDERSRLAREALATISRSTGAVDRTVRALAPLLDLDPLENRSETNAKVS